jgi:CcmD family protein
MTRFATLLVVMLTTLATQAAEAAWTDAYFRDGKYRVVVAILGIIFAGIVFYLVRLDRKIGKIEKELKNK